MVKHMTNLVKVYYSKHDLYSHLFTPLPAAHQCRVTRFLILIYILSLSRVQGRTFHLFTQRNHELCATVSWQSLTLSQHPQLMMQTDSAEGAPLQFDILCLSRSLFFFLSFPASASRASLSLVTPRLLPSSSLPSRRLENPLSRYFFTQDVYEPKDAVKSVQSRYSLVPHTVNYVSLTRRDVIDLCRRVSTSCV